MNNKYGQYEALLFSSYYKWKDKKDDYSKDHSVCNGNHTLSQSQGYKGATCEKNGYYSYECTREGCFYEKREKINALGHQWDSGTVTQEADCTHPEITTYRCTREDVWPACTEKKTEETKPGV